MGKNTTAPGAVVSSGSSAWLDPLNEQAAKDVSKALAVVLLLGGGLRAAYGIAGNVGRNMRRAEVRNRAEKPEAGAIIFNTKPEEEEDDTTALNAKSAKAAPLGWGADKPPLPAWVVPALLLGTPTAFAAGWMGISAYMKRYRKSRAREELEKAERDFEKALSAEQSTKVARELDDLAAAYVTGELDDTLEKSAGGMRRIDALLGLYLTALVGSAAVGAYGGWSMMGGAKGTKEVSAYAEAVRRRHAARSVGLTARNATDFDTSQDDTPEEKPGAEKQAGSVWSNLASAGIGSVLGAGLAAYGAKKWVESERGQRWKSQEALKTAQRMLEGGSGDRLAAMIYTSMLQRLKKQFAERNPRLGYFTNRYVT